MVVISRLFNVILQRLFDLKIHDFNCGLKVYTRDAAKSLRLYGGLHRFIPLLAYEEGFIIDEVVVQHSPRKYGKSKYGFSKLWKDLPDMFTMLFLMKYSKRPLHFFGVVGVVSIFLGTVIVIYLTILHYAYRLAVGYSQLLFMCLLFIVIGFQVYFYWFF